MIETLTLCPECQTLGMLAPNLVGKIVFFHKVPSPRLIGAFTFTVKHN